MRIAIMLLILWLAPGVTWAQDVYGEPYYGSSRLESGFTPDPHSIDVLAGGSRSAARLGNGCDGLISDRPDCRLSYETSGLLALYFYVDSPTDTTLVINDPAGNWVCDDDSGPDLNPRVKFTRPDSGTYNVWVGAFGEDDKYGDATLEISELGP